MTCSSTRASCSTTSRCRSAPDRPRSRTAWAAGPSPAPPAGSDPNPNDWIVGGPADAPLTRGQAAKADFARQPEIVDFLSGLFGRYPFSAAGGDRRRRRRARLRAREPDPADLLEGVLGTAARCRPTASSCTSSRTSGSATRWRCRCGSTSGSTRASPPTPSGSGARTRAASRPGALRLLRRDPGARTAFWTVVIGDPGPDLLFDQAVYFRGAMTLHALRAEIGDPAFFRLLRGLGPRQPGRQRRDPGVHRDGGADRRAPARRLLPPGFHASRRDHAWGAGHPLEPQRGARVAPSNPRRPRSTAANGLPADRAAAKGLRAGDGSRVSMAMARHDGLDGVMAETPPRGEGWPLANTRLQVVH